MATPPKNPKAPPPDPLADFDADQDAYDPYLEELDQSLKGFDEDPEPVPVPPKASPKPEAPKAPPRSKAPEPTKAVPPTPANKNVLNPDMLPLEVRVVIGQRVMTLAELLTLEAGSLVELQKPLEPVVELMVQDRVVARGELVQCDGRLGVKILTLVGVSS